MLSTFETVIYIAAALIPAFYLLRYVYKKDRIEKEPTKILVSLFLYGVLAAIPAMVLETIADELIMPSLSITNPTIYIIFYALMIGLVEEGCKYYFLYKRTWHEPHFNYLFDGIVYAVFVSLGFAAIENILYVFQYGLGTAALRAVLAVPGHMGFSVFMGIFYGRAKKAHVQGDKSGVSLNLLLAYVSSVFLHAFYDACAMLDTDLSLTIFLVFVVIMYVLVYNIIKKESLKDTSIY